MIRTIPVAQNMNPVPMRCTEREFIVGMCGDGLGFQDNWVQEQGQAG